MNEQLLAQAIRTEHQLLLHAASRLPELRRATRPGPLRRFRTALARKHFRGVRPDAKFDRLRQLTALSTLAQHEIAMIATATTELHISAGRHLAVEGRNASEVYLVAAGVVTVSQDGQLIGRAGAGDLLGPSALLFHTEREATFTAETDVDVFVVEPQRFQALRQSVPVFAALVASALDRFPRAPAISASMPDLETHITIGIEVEVLDLTDLLVSVCERPQPQRCLVPLRRNCNRALPPVDVGDRTCDPLQGVSK